MNKKFILVTTLLFLNLGYLFAQDWNEIIKVRSTDATGSNYFGWSVAIDGDYAIVGAYQNSAAGSYIFKRECDNWVQQQKLVASDWASGDLFGAQVAISGDYAIVGSNNRADTGTNLGAVYVFKRNGNTWTEVQKLVSPERSAENFGNYLVYIGGNTIAIQGDYIVIGAYGDGGDENEEEEFYQPLPDFFPDWWSSYTAGAGGVYIFKREGENWTQQQKILASDRVSGAHFGFSVDIDSNRIIVGARSERRDTEGENPLQNAGAAYIFELENDTWVEKQKLVASERSVGALFGVSTAISGDYAVISAPETSEGESTVVGSSYVFHYNGTSWVQQQRLTASDWAEDERFGSHVSIEGDTLVVGVHLEDEPGENPLENVGAVYVFTRDGAAWIEQQKIVASDREDYLNSDGNFGRNVGFDGTNIIVGAPFTVNRNEDGSWVRSGAAYVYKIGHSYFPPIEVETEVEICSGESATLTAVSEGNVILWYLSQDAETYEHYGADFTTPPLTETTSYWVEAYSPATGCVSSQVSGRIEVIVTVNPLPELTVLTPTLDICEGSTAHLEALTEEGYTVLWYDSADATEWIETGVDYITLPLTETTSYWVQSHNPLTNCVSERTEIVVTLLPAPELEAETAYQVCSGNEAYLYAYSEGNVVFWYENEEDEEYLYHGNLFVPEEILTETTTFWVEAYNIFTGCTSERIEVTVTVNPVPDAPIAVSYQIVEEGTTLADLDVEAEGTLTWYANEALTMVLPDTTLVEENVTYYVTQTIAGCESAATEVSIGFLGLSDINSNNFTVYPNPTQGIVKIRSKVGVTNIEVFNISGQTVTSAKASNEVNLTGSTSGTYVLRITLENGEVVTKKIIKK